MNERDSWDFNWQPGYVIEVVAGFIYFVSLSCESNHMKMRQMEKRFTQNISVFRQKMTKNKGCLNHVDNV